MIGKRTRYSLAQLLEQQDQARVIMLIAKHDGRISLAHGNEIHDLFRAVRNLDDQQVLAVVAEVVGTQGDLRHRISPRHRFHDRMHDLTQCLAMDGYLVED